MYVRNKFRGINLILEVTVPLVTIVTLILIYAKISVLIIISVLGVVTVDGHDALKVPGPIS